MQRDLEVHLSLPKHLITGAVIEDFKYTNIINYRVIANSYSLNDDHFLLSKNIRLDGALDHIDIIKELSPVLCNHKVTRIKIEEMFYNIGIPETPTPYEFEPYEYFETHIKVDLPNFHDNKRTYYEFLTESLPNISLSWNFNKPNNVFVTTRYKNCGKQEVEAKLQEQLLFLRDLTGVTINEVEKEFVSYDSFLNQDIEWCPVIDLRKGECLSGSYRA